MEDKYSNNLIKQITKHKRFKMVSLDFIRHFNQNHIYKDVYGKKECIRRNKKKKIILLPFHLFICI